MVLSKSSSCPQDAVSLSGSQHCIYYVIPCHSELSDGLHPVLSTLGKQQACLPGSQSAPCHLQYLVFLHFPFSVFAPHVN